MQQKIVTKLFSDVGTGELFMARLWHFQDYVLSGLFGFSNQKNTQDMIWKVVFDGLVPAFQSLRDLRAKEHNPKIAEIEKRRLAESVYNYLVIAFKDRFQIVTNSMGYNIGFIFKGDSEFNYGLIEFKKLHPKIDHKSIEFIKSDRDGWQKILFGVRNNVINHQLNNDSKNIKELEGYLTLENTEMIFNNCWRAIEDYLYIFTLDMVNPAYKSALLELQEYKNNNDYITRFGWFIIA